MTTSTPGAPVPAAPFTELSARRLGPVRRFFVRRPVAMDVVVALCFLLPASPNVVMPPSGGSRVGTLVLVLGGAAVLMWRRHRPVLTAVALAVLAAVCVAVTGSLSGFDLGIGLAVYAVAASRPPRVAWSTWAGVVLGTTLVVWLLEQPLDLSDAPELRALVEDGGIATDNRVASVTGLVIFSLAALAIGTNVRNRRLHVADLVERANALARDRDRQAELARASERSRIAREMHDVVAHSLSVMIALADGASVTLDRSPDRSRAALEELSGTGRAALADMRRVLGVLADDGAPLAPQPGAEDLTTLVERFRTTGLRVRTAGLGTPLPPDTGVQLAVYRIVQESLTNALRHAPGTSEVEVTLERAPGCVVVEVRDRGAGLPRTDAGGAGQGLIGMKERAALYGGTVEAGPWGDGWRVRAELPWVEEDV